MHQRLATKLINGVSAAAWLPRQVRVSLWRAAGISVGTIVDVRSGCWMNTSRLTIGDRVFINAKPTVDGFERVAIGDESCARGQRDPADLVPPGGRGHEAGW